jgi:hypothetical protein
MSTQQCSDLVGTVNKKKFGECIAISVSHLLTAFDTFEFIEKQISLDVKDHHKIARKTYMV